MKNIACIPQKTNHFFVSFCYKCLLLSFLTCLSLYPTKAQKLEADEKVNMDELVSALKRMDSIEQTFTYQHGIIQLPNGVAKLNVPSGFKYLDAKQANRVLVDLWGNPPGENLSLGMLLPDSQGVMSYNGFVFNIQYDEIGFVEDNDANDINYDELLSEMQKDVEEENKERVKEGFDAITIVGWAAAPYYDKEKNILHWAKEAKFGNSESNTLNYNVRILGRKGVLVLNAIATMDDLPLVQKEIPNVLSIVQFNEGFQYRDFEPGVDKVAAITIGGLVAGKVLAKVGFFAIILKFWKLIALAVFGFFGAFWKKITGKKDPEVVYENTETIPENGDDTSKLNSVHSEALPPQDDADSVNLPLDESNKKE